MDTNSSGNSSSQSGPSMEETFEHIYPSLLQCFIVILLGYCTGRLGYISPTSSKGIGVFVSLISLPALLFKSMVELDYSQVNWKFLFSILIAKSTVFFSVVLFTLILVRPTNFGKAGIYGIFCSQSNDMALGYPLGTYISLSNIVWFQKISIPPPPTEGIFHMNPTPLDFPKTAHKLYPSPPPEIPIFSYTPWKYIYFLFKAKN